MIEVETYPKQKVVKFEDLVVWKESMWLVSEIYKALKNCRDFGFRDQIQRSAVSIPSNIAEGFDRQSNKEFIQYLHIAKGSCSEVRTQLYLAQNLELLSNKSVELLVEKSRQISAMLSGLIRTRNEKF